MMRLAAHERYEAIGAIDEILRAIGMLKDDALQRAERKLANGLREKWRERYEASLNGAFELGLDIDDILERLIESMGENFGADPSVIKLLQDAIKKEYGRGKISVTSIDNKPKPEGQQDSLSLPDLRAIDTLTKHNCFWLQQHYGEHIGPKISEATQESLRDGTGRNELRKKLEGILAGDAPADYKYWGVVASAALVRGRSFGVVSGLVEAEIAAYEIIAMGDERMCKICGAMNGRVFSVADAAAKIADVMDVKDPQAFKDAMPWKSGSPSGISNDELMRQGRALPPFHGRCRCVVSASSFTDEDIGAIKSYMSGGSYTLNAKLRDGEKLSPIEVGYVKSLDAALNKVPDWKGTTYRNINLGFVDDEEYRHFIRRHRTDNAVNYPAYTSSSESLEGYEIDGPKGAHLKIQSKHGKNIQQFGILDEQEIVFRRDSKFKIKSIETVNDEIYIEMEEL